MSKPGIIYRMTWINFELQNMKVDILDNSILIADGSTEQIIPMIGAADCFHTSNIDNNEDKFSPIKAKKAVINILNTDAINLDTFATGEDNRFEVKAYCNSLLIFIGWLEQGDISEPFLPRVKKQLTLTAIDGLSFLKTQRLTDFNSINPKNEHNLIQYISWCLFRTGHNLNINVINNLREEENPGLWQTTAQFNSPNNFSVPVGYPKYYKPGNKITISGSASNDGTYTVASVADLGGLGGIVMVVETITAETGGPTITFTDINTYGNIYGTLFLDAKTFEDQINSCIYCDQVLTAILGHDCFITQAKGGWWIVRVRELRTDFIQYKTVFDSGGILLSFSTHNYDKAIGSPNVISGVPLPSSYFAKTNSGWLRQRPNKYVRLTYPYNLPLELICNINFERGTFIADLPNETDPDGKVLTVKSYTPECWEYDKQEPPVTQNSVAYIKRLFYNDREKERFIHMVATVGAGFYYLKCTDKTPMGYFDKFTISCSIRYGRTGVYGGSGHFQVSQLWVRLYGDDGTFWNLHSVSGSGSSDPNPYWTQSVANWSTGQKFCDQEGEASGLDTSKWQTLSFEAAALPVSGKIEVLLLNQQTANLQTKDFSSLALDYLAYINGSYQVYKSQSNMTTRDKIYLPSIEDNVSISNSPRKLFKGALLKFALNDYFLVDGFYEGQEFLFANDGRNNLRSYGELQVRAYHNQFRNSDEIYQAECQGIGAGAVDGDGFDDSPDIIHRYFNRDLEPLTNQKALQLVTQDKNWKDCSWKGTLIKNFDSNIGFVQDAYEFDYNQ